MIFFRSNCRISKLHKVIEKIVEVFESSLYPSLLKLSSAQVQLKFHHTIELTNFSLSSWPVHKEHFINSPIGFPWIEACKNHEWYLQVTTIQALPMIGIGDTKHALHSGHQLQIVCEPKDDWNKKGLMSAANIENVHCGSSQVTWGNFVGNICYYSPTKLS